MTEFQNLKILLVTQIVHTDLKDKFNIKFFFYDILLNCYFLLYKVYQFSLLTFKEYKCIMSHFVLILDYNSI